MPRLGREIDPAIAEAIGEGIKAGAFWRAARLNPNTAHVWETMGADFTKRAKALLSEAAPRLVREPGRARSRRRQR